MLKNSEGEMLRIAPEDFRIIKKFTVAIKTLERSLFPSKQRGTV
jgi:hypothetical protein